MTGTLKRARNNQRSSLIKSYRSQFTLKTKSTTNSKTRKSISHHLNFNNKLPRCSSLRLNPCHLWLRSLRVKSPSLWMTSSVSGVRVKAASTRTFKTSSTLRAIDHQCLLWSLLRSKSWVLINHLDRDPNSCQNAWYSCSVSARCKRSLHNKTLITVHNPLTLRNRHQFRARVTRHSQKKVALTWTTSNNSMLLTLQSKLLIINLLLVLTKVSSNLSNRFTTISKPSCTTRTSCNQGTWATMECIKLMSKGTHTMATLKVNHLTSTLFNNKNNLRSSLLRRKWESNPVTLLRSMRNLDQPSLIFSSLPEKEIALEVYE